MSNIIEFKPKEKIKPDFKINESAVRDFISSITINYMLDKYGDMVELLEIAEGSELHEKIINDRLEFEQKITLNWERHLEHELRAQRLENEGISRIEQADREREFFDDLYARAGIVL